MWVGLLDGWHVEPLPGERRPVDARNRGRIFRLRDFGRARRIGRGWSRAGKRTRYRYWNIRKPRRLGFGGAEFFGKAASATDDKRVSTAAESPVSCLAVCSTGRSTGPVPFGSASWGNPFGTDSARVGMRAVTYQKPLPRIM